MKRNPKNENIKDQRKRGWICRNPPLQIGEGNHSQLVLVKECKVNWFNGKVVEYKDKEFRKLYNK